MESMDRRLADWGAGVHRRGMLSDKIQTYPLGPIETNAFRLKGENGSTIWVDAPEGAFAAMEMERVEGLVPVALILTHGHWDHTTDAWRFAEAGIPIYGHRADAVLFEQPEVMAPFAMPGIQLQPVVVDHWLAGGDVLEIAGWKLEVRETPGHCPGNITLVSSADGLAFVGDVIFAGSVGRTDLPGGDFEELERSIRTRIYTLPEETLLYPGHGPVTQVAREKAMNGFVRG